MHSSRLYILYIAVHYCTSLYVQVGKVYLGEGAGMIYSVEEAEKITRDVASEAEEQLNNLNKLRSS